MTKREFETVSQESLQHFREFLSSLVRRQLVLQVDLQCDLSFGPNPHASGSYSEAHGNRCKFPILTCGRRIRSVSEPKVQRLIAFIARLDSVHVTQVLILRDLCYQDPLIQLVYAVYSWAESGGPAKAVDPGLFIKPRY